VKLNVTRLSQHLNPVLTITNWSVIELTAVITWWYDFVVGDRVSSSLADIRVDSNASWLRACRVTSCPEESRRSNVRLSNSNQCQSSLGFHVGERTGYDEGKAVSGCSRQFDQSGGMNVFTSLCVNTWLFHDRHHPSLHWRVYFRESSARGPNRFLISLEVSLEESCRDTSTDRRERIFRLGAAILRDVVSLSELIPACAQQHPRELPRLWSRLRQ